MSFGFYKLKCFLGFALAYCLFYLYPNFFPPSPPTQLPMLMIDQKTPFLPWTFFIYLSDYLLVLLVILWISDLETFKSYARRAYCGLFVCGFFFIFFPTIYPRPEYPTNQPLLIQGILSLMKAADQPTNCFPSMHVAMTATATYGLRTISEKKYLMCVLWSILIFISTLTTKQHYFLDIIGGLTVTSVIAFLDWFLFERKENPKSLGLNL